MKIINKLLLCLYISTLFLFPHSINVNAEETWTPLEKDETIEVDSWSTDSSWHLLSSTTGFIGNTPYYETYKKSYQNATYYYSTSKKEIKTKTNTLTSYTIGDNLIGTIDDYLYFYDSKYSSYYYGENNSEYFSGYIYTIYKIDEDLNQVGFITLSNTIYSNNYLSQVEDKLYLISLNQNKYTYGTTSYCNIFEISNDFQTSTTLECSTENIENYNEEISIQYKNALNDNQVSLKDNHLAMIKDNTLIFFEDNEQLWSVQASTNETLSKVKILDNLIIVIKDNMYDSSSNSYKSEILVYDHSGNLLDTINNNTYITSLNINKDNNQLAIYNSYIEGTCTDETTTTSSYYSTTYYNTTGCSANLTVDIYSLTQQPTTEEIPVPEEESKEEINNPDTKDITIITFLTIFIINIYLYRKTKHSKKLI